METGLARRCTLEVEEYAPRRPPSIGCSAFGGETISIRLLTISSDSGGAVASGHD